MNAKLPAPVLVNRPDQFDQLVRDLNQHTQIAVDTESNSLFAYREQVCLIQFSTPEQDYLLDPLALKDLSALKSLFADPKKEKIFHAAEYDLLVLQRDHGFEFANLFDTMLAARIAGREKFGLGNLLEEEFRVVVEKRFQRANWGKRPLPSGMISYARLDTHYLIPLRERLLKQVEEHGRLAIMQEDLKRMCQVNGTPPAPGGVNIWRIKDVRDLNPQQTAVLQKCAEYREARAEKLNLPVFKVIGDKTLVEVARTSPRNERELKKLFGMSATQMSRHARGLLRAVREGMQGDPLYPPPRKPYDEEYAERYEALRQWRKDTAQNMSVESDVVLPRDLLEQLAHEDPTDLNGVRAILADLPWRQAHYSEAVHGLLSQLRGS